MIRSGFCCLEHWHQTSHSLPTDAATSSLEAVSAAAAIRATWQHSVDLGGFGLVILEGGTLSGPIFPRILCVFLKILNEECMTE